MGGCFFGRRIEVAWRARGFGGYGGFTVGHDPVADLMDVHAQPLGRAAAGGVIGGTVMVDAVDLA